MTELSIEKFNPTLAELKTLVEGTKSVVVTDFKDKAQLDAVKTSRASLRNARIAITEKGKELRQDALAFQKAVIEKEKELVAILTPEENRLKAIEEEVKLKKIRAERMALLPERKKKLHEIDGRDYSDADEVLLSMDAAEFQAHCNLKLSQRNEAKQKELDDKERELEAKELEITQEKEAQEREETAREGEREKAKQRERERIDREAQEKKAEEERLMEAEQEKMKNEKIMSVLKKHSVIEGSAEWKRVLVGDTFYLYKLVEKVNLNE